MRTGIDPPSEGIGALIHSSTSFTHQLYSLIRANGLAGEGTASESARPDSRIACVHSLTVSAETGPELPTRSAPTGSESKPGSAASTSRGSLAEQCPIGLPDTGRML